ncbi:hypothetical protein [Billgrantia endophytica]|uniref:hypothetical protein n=1 Tax=Billgrantia endophytica TaxID=2033802 RepID=UPI0010561010|nr:hypothetical protein [Halomonas endophytica]
MKNKMMKTVGIALVSTSMLVANGVVAHENTESVTNNEESSKVYILATLNKGMGVLSRGLSSNSSSKDENYNFTLPPVPGLITLSSITVSATKYIASYFTSEDNNEISSIEGTLFNSTEDFKINASSVSVTTISNTKNYEDLFTDKDSKVTTFTSQDGTLEIKVTERDGGKENTDHVNFKVTRTVHLSTQANTLDERMKEQGYKIYEPEGKIENFFLGRGTVYKSKDGARIVNVLDK